MPKLLRMKQYRTAYLLSWDDCGKLNCCFLENSKISSLVNAISEFFKYSTRDFIFAASKTNKFFVKECNKANTFSHLYGCVVPEKKINEFQVD